MTTPDLTGRHAAACAATDAPAHQAAAAYHGEQVKKHSGTGNYGYAHRHKLAQSAHVEASQDAGKAERANTLSARCSHQR